MRPSVGLGRPSPNMESLLVVCGKVRYTGIKINPQQFRDGSLSICEENGLYYIICNGKMKKRFQVQLNVVTNPVPVLVLLLNFLNVSSVSMAFARYYKFSARFPFTIGNH